MNDDLMGELPEGIPASIKKKLYLGNSFPLLKVGTEPVRMCLYSKIYGMYSAIKGIVPAINVMLDGSINGERNCRTMIVNQRSVGSFIWPLMDEWDNGDADIWFTVRRADGSKCAPYILEREANPPDGTNYPGT